MVCEWFVKGLLSKPFSLYFLKTNKICVKMKG